MKKIRELLRGFRDSDTYQHIIYVQYFAPKKVRKIITEEILDFDEERFRDIMAEYFMLGRMGEQAIDYILRNNDFNDVKFRLLNLFVGKKPIVERFKAFLEIKGIDLFFGTHFLRATGEDDFVIYHDYVLKGIKELLPKIAPNRVETVEEYMDFNDLCKEIRDIYGFKDLGELHEFFWHGYKNKWKSSWE